MPLLRDFVGDELEALVGCFTVKSYAVGTRLVAQASEL